MAFAEAPTQQPTRSSGFPWLGRRSFEAMDRSPRLRLPKLGRPVEGVIVDRVRAAPAISPSLSMNIGLTALGLGLWGSLFPNHVKKTLGIRAAAPVVQAVFGARELATGSGLAADPTRAGLLWTRVAGDVFDIAVLRSLDRPDNPRRGTAKVALGAVLAITALDAMTAVRMTNVRRNCD